MAVITVSRQFGAGDKTLLLKVAAYLGHSVAYEEIIETIATKAWFSADGVKAYVTEGGKGLRQHFAVEPEAFSCPYDG